MKKSRVTFHAEYAVLNVRIKINIKAFILSIILKILYLNLGITVRMTLKKTTPLRIKHGVAFKCYLYVCKSLLTMIELF